LVARASRASRALRGLLLASLPLLGSCASEGGGPQCTLVGCGTPSTFTLTLEHQLPLDQGPHQLRVDTGLFEVRCSVGVTATGDATCFGYRFTDLAWTASEVTVTLIDPFYDADLNPNSLPFEQVDVRVTRGTDELASLTVAVDGGEPQQPNGPDCAPSCWQATARATLP
jgi:hypothetical protein